VLSSNGHNHCSVYQCETQIFIGNLRKMSTCLVFKVSGVFIYNLEEKFKIVSSFQFVQRRILAAFSSFDKAYLLNYWSYEGTWRPIGKKRKSSISMLFNSWSESSHNSINFVFFDCCLQSSQIWHQFQDCRFQVLLAEPNIVTCNDGIKTYDDS
jgi:hypothetical protein